MRRAERYQAAVHFADTERIFFLLLAPSCTFAAWPLARFFSECKTDT
jgi:hypothetical protein